ncbi:phytanoyl-CoA dioxygenase family protein [Parasphingorhabdus cellanae]|uniref:Phytanoyl-CoA dioxygenase family protein n=1 Tax=Parasphingorhabdus cellanae TaxID=2806553 RepID=A0ABX7T2X7_9SPHN|nr:phytanoyl-CoA dioxygenase family protein [Parasphingorhabdus cellanae]QTD54884.1 phytanoyl-CoA dioxygenase family protein [Parasphingorhabdus cellanae]
MEFEARGITKCDGLASKADAIVARDLIYEIAAEHSLHQSTGWQRSQSRFGIPKPFRAAINALNHADHFPNLVSEELVKVAEGLLGEPVRPLAPGQQILFTLPEAVSWSVPNDVWHVDVPRLGDLGPSGVQMFTFLDDVQPKGGGTLVLAGSHRLMNNSHHLRSKELKRLLGREKYFQSLFDANRKPITHLEDTAGSVDDVDLEVVELTGQIGDVYFMDLRMLHTPAPNSAQTPRVMLTCRLPRTAVAAKLLDQGIS